MVYGLKNKFRVHILREEPVYSKEDLDKIVGKHISPLPACLKNVSAMSEWLTVYHAFTKAGLSSKKATEETDERIIWYD